jgi:hypothetical protein
MNNSSGQRATGLLPCPGEEAYVAYCVAKYISSEKWSRYCWTLLQDHEKKQWRKAAQAAIKSANRWSDFSDEELKLLDICLECSCRYDEELDAIQNGIEDELRHRGETREMREWPELTRRHATGEGEI